jgi:MFS family permease
MQSTAQGFLVYDLTQSPAYLGAVAFAMGLPVWMFMLYAGVVADRISRQKLILISQTAMMILAFVLAALTFTNTVRPWHIIVLAFLLGVAHAFDAPARQSFFIEMVGREALPNAIALNSSMFNAALAVGPAFGGLTYAAFGPGWCFIINGATYGAVIFSLLKMRLKVLPQTRIKERALTAFFDGIAYIRKNETILTMVFLVSVFCFFGISLVTLFPAWAVKILAGDARTNGFLMAARGSGALLGALFLASLGKIRYKGKALFLGVIFFPCMFLLFAFSRDRSLSYVILTMAGFFQILILNLSNILIQELTEDEFRGRVMSVYAFSFFGFLPAGSLFVGILAERFGLPLTVLAGALMCLITGAAFLIRKPWIKAL